MASKSVLLLSFTALALTSALAAAKESDPAPEMNPGTAPPEAVAKWQDMRFGMFIHWGPVSLTGHEIGWSRGNQTPIEEYDNLYKRFNPVKFDAEAWARTAKAAGMKYMVLTTKHHDGFCLWDSAATDYDIMATPFHRDVVKELSEACRKEGIAFGTYYSACDWHHPAFPLGSPGGKSKKPHPDMKAYAKYLQQQVTELATKYGPLVTMWFDVPQAYTQEYGIPMVKKLRTLQPDIIVNNRAYSNRGRKHGRSVGDFDTPEQRVGSYQDGRPWETCMTICRQWAWKPNDKMKSKEQCLQTLVTCAGGNGNLLFNVGPMPDGRIEPRQVARLKEMGEWLGKYGESIYGTRGGPVKPGKGFATTRKGNVVYLHVFPSAPGEISLPALPRKVTGAEILGGGGSVKIQTGPESWTVNLPAERRKPIDTIVKITLDGSAMDLEAVAPPTDFRGAKASNVFQKQTKKLGPAMVIDGNPATRWATDTGTKSCWIEVQLTKPTAIRGIEIDETPEYSGRVQAFTLKVKTAKGAWKTVAEGTKLGKFRAKFAPVKAEAIRLDVSKASEGPTISEIRINK